MNKCDIIIPIYNAYECVIECVDSVVKNTNLKENRLILINDKSSDERIFKLLKKYKKEYKEFIVLENLENKGFVGTVNVGMKYSDKNDVLLLNSDTVVTPNWLDNIKKCAYSGDNIGTVTPLSNNATMASVPVPFVKNELPTGISINDMAKIVEENSYLDYPDLPTGHGFCLYIKREVLNKIGFFDEETFGKGYGEENDFCFRCLDIGYRNLLCDNVYIYHKESQSFSDSKIALMKSGGEKLRKRYPIYTDRLDEWCRSLPIRYIGENVGFSIGKKNSRNKPNILILIHDWYDVENHLGGTTLHVYDIIKKLRDKYNFHVLAPVNNVYYLNSYWEKSESRIAFPIFFDSRNFESYNNDYKNILNTIFDNFSIDFVHIHHMKNHYFDIIDVSKKYNSKIIYSVHDFYSVCPIINKMYCNKEYCGNPSKKQCQDCMKKIYNYNEVMITEWRNNFKKLFENSVKIICPSKGCKDELLITFPKINVEVIEHGSNLEKKYDELYIESNEKINVAFLGAIGYIKGSNILNSLLNRKYTKNINLHLFGTIDRILSKKQKKYIYDHGKYNRDELSNLLSENNIKIICLLSICPETFSYTLTEAVANGIPVIVSNLGALKDRVEKDNLGWIIDVSSETIEDDLIKLINDIRNNPDEYLEKVKSIKKYKIKNVDTMVNEYNELYKKLGPTKNTLKDSDIKSLIHLNNKYVSYVSYADYAWVFDTLKWKIISKIKIPKSIKKIVRRNNND